METDSLDAVASTAAADEREAMSDGEMICWYDHKPCRTGMQPAGANLMTINRMAYEGDIVSRLKNWRGLHLAHCGNLFDEAAQDIARLRGDAEVAKLDHEHRRALVKSAQEEAERLREAIRRLADQDATLSVREGNVTVTMDATLTDAEVDLLRRLGPSAEPLASYTVTLTPADRKTINGILSRLGGGT